MAPWDRSKPLNLRDEDDSGPGVPRKRRRSGEDEETSTTADRTWRIGGSLTPPKGVSLSRVLKALGLVLGLGGAGGGTAWLVRDHTAKQEAPAVVVPGEWKAHVDQHITESVNGYHRIDSLETGQAALVERMANVEGWAEKLDRRMAGWQLRQAYAWLWEAQVAAAEGKAGAKERADDLRRDIERLHRELDGAAK